MSTLERVAAALEDVPHTTVEVLDGCPCIALESRHLPVLAEHLRDRCGFDSITFATAVDLYPAEPRFELSYQFLSLEHDDRLRVKVHVGESECSVPTITHVYPGAGYCEREAFDMFGIRFDGHEGLARLYMPDEYEHHPLRKDFPHRGIEPDKLYREWERKRAGGNTYRS